MAASEVDLPEPVPPTKITSPRLVMATSLRTCGRFRSSNLGIVAVMVRSTMPTRPCWTKAFTRKRPTPEGEMAKLHSLVASNSAACLSVMIERASSCVWIGDRLCCDTGVTLPSTFIAGGKPAVMKRSEPLRAMRARSRSCMNLRLCSRSMVSPVARRASARERVLVGGLGARLGDRDEVALHQVLQVLVEGLHAEGLARLDRRVHLGDLRLADQVA